MKNRLGKERRFTFGKYEGFTFEQVLNKDVKYMEFMSCKFSRLFSDYEHQAIRNKKFSLCNHDFNKPYCAKRTPLENELYNIARQIMTW